MPRANGITRQEILTSIKRNGAMTAEELARELGISQVAVRQHLSALEAEAIIAVMMERRGLGRPAHRYMLTTQGDEMFPRQYATLTNTLLDDLRAWQGEEMLHQLFTRRRERMQTQLQPAMEDKPLSARMQMLARILNEQGFMARVIEENDGDFRLIKNNCAFYSVACKHPSVCCAGDLEFYEALLGNNVEIHSEKEILNGDHACIFRIRSCERASQQDGLTPDDTND